ncbi:alpha/beta hydrolase-fold protein [Flavobacteriaceae bacterium S0825]|uniref:alpha/beta hydrolase n=1 Tax=Gaetbulibacter sp. S0825 TaxID=2720084 RepID=UPI001430EA91|nr:alpha/beta hydrolase-fold protein [Gaetbulibacter sp. S0825]MCK0107913.1 alpha/beta hydrolase-fold protein [Flavobacteriaceae bacterium S0825]NIX63549.1 alpha/beta hydrolase [Gaetbulibacter sp. S0825]
MIKRIVFSTFISCLLVVSVNAQNSPTNNTIGTNHFIKSKALGEERQIQVYLPQNYAHSNEKYPVVYVLDGQRFFLYSVSLNQSFKQFQLTPEFIVVGINTDYPKRFQDLGEGKEKFIEFVSTELIPYIDTNFRTNNEKLFFGWEFGASLVFNTMLSNPTLFDAHIMASAYPIMEAIDKLNGVSTLPTNLYFSISPDEYDGKHSAVKLDSLLSQKNIEGLQWTFLNLYIEKHRSTGYPTLYHGLRNYYKYYQEFETNNLQKFINAGGLDYANRYAKERANRYGFSPELSLWSKFTIIRSAMRAEDFYHFETLLNALDKEKIIDGLMSGNMEYAVSHFANFYVKSNRFKEAVELYDVLLEKYPDSEKLLKEKTKAIKKIKI